MAQEKKKPLNSKPPTDLKKEVIPYWKKVFTEIGYRLNNEHIFVLREYCRVLYDIDSCRDALELEGQVQLDGNGKFYKHPLVDILKTAQGSAVKLEDRLGLSPRADGLLKPAKEVGEKKISSVMSALN